jgi:8-oxo-dGTP diphosphatase
MLQEKLNEIGNDKKAVVAVMVRDGKILTGQRNYTKEKWKDISVWTIPGGRCDAGETLEQALRREVAEEVNISDFTIVDYIGEVAGAKEGDILIIFFCATNQESKLMEPEKFSEWRWITKEEYIANEQYSGFNFPARELIVDFLKAKG